MTLDQLKTRAKATKVPEKYELRASDQLHPGRGSENNPA